MIEYINKNVVLYNQKLLLKSKRGSSRDTVKFEKLPYKLEISPKTGKTEIQAVNYSRSFGADLYEVYKTLIMYQTKLIELDDKLRKVMQSPNDLPGLNQIDLKDIELSTLILTNTSCIAMVGNKLEVKGPEYRLATVVEEIMKLLDVSDVLSNLCNFRCD